MNHWIIIGWLKLIFPMCCIGLQKVGIQSAVKQNPEDIVLHEYGHVLSFHYKSNGIEIAKQAYYNIFGKKLNDKEILKELKSISGYCPVYTGSPDDIENGRIKPEKYTEITPEMLVFSKYNDSAFAKEYIRILLGR